jgi:hypothetical protein
MAKTATKAAANTPASPDAKTATRLAPRAPAKSPAKPAVTAKAAPAPAPPPPAAPKPLLRTTGLSPREQKLQALRAKLAHQTSGARPAPGASAQAFSAKTSFAGKKTSFQRKAV